MNLVLHIIMIMVPVGIIFLLHHLSHHLAGIDIHTKILIEFFVYCIDFLLILFIFAGIFSPMTTTVLQGVDYTRKFASADGTFTTFLPVTDIDGNHYYYYMKIMEEDSYLTARVPAEKVVSIEEVEKNFRVEKYAEIPWFIPPSMRYTWNAQDDAFYKAYIPIGDLKGDEYD